MIFQADQYLKKILFTASSWNPDKQHCIDVSKYSKNNNPEIKEFKLVTTLQ